MAIFAVLHLWAFPYRHPYANAAELAEHKALSANSSIINNGMNGHMARDQLEDISQIDPAPIQGTKKRKPHTGYTKEQPAYEGGPLGVKALIDALNPWDIIKATGRGFRWLFVGVKKRNDPVGLATLHQVVVPDSDVQLPLHTAYQGQTYIPHRAESTSPAPPYGAQRYPFYATQRHPSPHPTSHQEDNGMFSPHVPRDFGDWASAGESGAGSPVRRSAELHIEQARTREGGGNDEEDDRRGLLRGAQRIAGR